MAFLGPWRGSRRDDGADGTRRRRRPGCLWMLFWIILVIIVLGLVFGGYRKGTKSAPAPAGGAERVVATAPYGAAYGPAHRGAVSSGA